MAASCTQTSDSATVEMFYPPKAWSGGGERRAGGMDTAVIPKGCGPPARWAPNFEVIDGLLYRKKLERGFVNYREVLDEDRRHEALSTFHQRMRPGQRHLSLEETYKCVAENYWWEGMYFQIRDFVLGCPECRGQHTKTTEELGGRGCITKTMSSHSDDVLSKLRSQREAGMFCDITLRTNGRPYLAHKAVLAAVSDHFQEVFTEMDSNMKADVDLTGFSEDSLLSLLDFSYSSTLCVRQEDLPEVMAMARHLGMWLAVEACSSLIKDQEQQLHPGKGQAGTCHGRHHQQRESKRKGGFGLEHNMDDSFGLMLDASDECLEGSPKRDLLMLKTEDHNGLPLSPSHRMKLMDFKSPSSKKVATPRHAIGTLQPQNCAHMSPPNTRLLRSSPGAAKELQRLLPMLESPQRIKKPHSVVTRLSFSPVKVKQEVEEIGEDEQDYARAQEKYKLMNVLGLQRTALLPRPEDLIGWRQKKRLRKLKANNYSLTKRRKPRSTSPGLPAAAVTLSLPLCTPANTRLLSKVKAKPASRVVTEPMTKKSRKAVPQNVPPSDRSMRSKCVLPDIFAPSFRGRELRQSVRKSDSSHRVSQRPLQQRNTNKPRVRTAVKIKSEPLESSISGPAFPSNHRRGVTSSPSRRTQAGNKVTVEAVKKLRYNSSRPASKARLRQIATREGEKCKPREEGRKVDGQGLRGIMDTRQRVKVGEPNEFNFSQQQPPPSIYNHPLYKVIKEEPAEPVPVGAFSDPPSLDRGKRQSKPPIKLLDSGFLFSFCRPAGGPMAALKKEEESVDICLTRSVSRVGEKFAERSPHRALRARGTPTLPMVKQERTANRRQARSTRPTSRSNTIHLAMSAEPKTMPKQQGKRPLSSRSCVVLDSVRRARLKQLRGPRSQAPKVPKAVHACLQCPAFYNDCDALIMHRLRHIEGKHWPCPLCSKTFFRLRNVRSHIHTHDPKLYKCRSCIAAGS